jgi:glycosyltransferase involved in cell wall biosynthesis
MRILVLDANYPHADNLYGDVFVHVRVARYIALGHTVRVVAFFTDLPDYTFDGVSVSCAPDLATLIHLIDEFSPDVVAIHFFQGWMLRKILQRMPAPSVIWVHGMEALAWYRRLFNFNLSREFFEYAKYSTLQIYRFRKLLRYARHNPGRVTFVFVSDWMRRIAEKDTLTRAPAHHVIPNPIDGNRFPYIPKDPALRTRVLLIRSFDSRKYANDIAINAIRQFETDPEFHRFHFSIYGQGRMFDRLTRPIRHLPNITISEGYLTQQLIREVHATHGVMLCPTRQDAQGVSMCEAMSSGLVPVTSRSSAIPEFVADGVTGFLTSGSREIVGAFRRLYHDPNLFTRMSQAAAADIRAKSGIDLVVDRELGVMQAAADAFR